MNLQSNYCPTTSSIRKRLRCLITLILAAFLASLLAWSALAASPDPGPTLGTNLTWLRPNTGEWPFVDAFKTSLPWIAVERYGCFGCPAAGDLDLDPNGWVESLDTTNVGNGGQAAVALLFLQAVDMYPEGLYTVLYDGGGTIDYGGSATLVSSQPGRDVIDVDPSSSEPLVISIYATDPAPHHLRNIRVIMPGGVCTDDPFRACDANADCPAGSCEMFVDNYATQIFHPTFLNNARRFDVVRLMDWMETNQASNIDYSQYPTLQSAHWPVAPFEIMAELGNRLSADLWVAVPHVVDASFTQSMAVALRDGLAPEHKIFVERSNEVWNADYDQFDAATQGGCSEFPGLTAGCAADSHPGNSIVCEGHPWPHWNSACETARQQYQSRRSVEVWDLFEQVFGGTQRLVRVLASQSGNVWNHGGMLAFEDTYLKTDAFAAGAYFGWELGGDPRVAGWTPDQLFSVLQQQEVPTAIDLMRDDQQFLLGTPEYASIPLVIYEGGQGLVTWGAVEADTALNSAVSTLYENVNKDARMGDLYDQLFAGWQQEGGGNLFLHYVNVHAYRSWGRYGALEHQDQPHCDSPKYRALIRFIEGEQCP